MKQAFDWLDDRTGYRRLLKEVLYENVPGGARWRYVWGSCLTFAFFTQIITGVLLWTAYSPSVQTAWESVYFIQEEMTAGWFLRGVHHFMAQAMIILLALHLMQVVIDGAYRAPREVNFWFGVILLLLTLALSLTGYLLPWDQKGYWATKVATNLVALTPLIGSDLQTLLVGGSEYGHHTLTRFFALHAGILPGLMILFIVGHVYLFRKHGIKSKKPHRSKDSAFWPDQVFKDAVACFAVLLTVVFLTVYFKGAPLADPADPADQYSAARPEWYFLFLFQLLKYFSGKWAIVGALVIPGLVMTWLIAQPFIARWEKGHRLNVGALWGLLGGMALLTWLAIAEDQAKDSFQVAVEESAEKAVRVKELAKLKGIPPRGAVSLLHEDPKTQGPRIFAAHCSGCHRYDGHDGRGNPVSEEQSAPDLAGFASHEWMEKLLDYDHYVSVSFFGNTKFADGAMAKHLAHFNEEEKELVKKVAALLSDLANLPYQKKLTVEEQEAGFSVFEEESLSSLPREGKNKPTKRTCIDCHDDGSGPNLMLYELENEPSYGSRRWLIEFLKNPDHESFYDGENDRMPAFGINDKLTPLEIELVVDWLRRDWVSDQSANQ